MLRLTFLLCSGLFLVMLLGGRDFGQLRPGLAQVAAEAKNFPTTAAVPSVETAALVDNVTLSSSIPAPATVAPLTVEAVPVPATVQVERVVVVPPADQIVQARSVPAEIAPQSEPENTVFTLSDYADPAPDVAPIVAERAAEGEVWYVAGNSLNVRSGPSTNDAVVGKLTRGEATLVVWREGPDWARIRIEGDGIEGYVAMRFLTPDVPAVN